MNVVRFPIVPKQRPEEDPVAIMTTALAHLEQLVSIYREVGARPNPVTILMMIASILDEPQLRKAANLAANLAAGSGAPPTASREDADAEKTG